LMKLNCYMFKHNNEIVLELSILQVLFLAPMLV
jgi:hypothetical protein